MRLVSYMFAPNFGAIAHVTSILGPENSPESLTGLSIDFLLVDWKLTILCFVSLRFIFLEHGRFVESS